MQSKPAFRWIAAAAVASLLGCATGAKSGPPGAVTIQSCAGSSCDLVVRDGLDDHGQCQVEVVDRTDVSGHDVKMTWRMDAAASAKGYKFATYGIVINDYDPPRNFDSPKFRPDEVSWHNRNDGAHEYKYTVYATRYDIPCKPLDPYIRNQ